MNAETNRSPDIEVFTQTHCAPCRQLEAFLREREISFTVRDVGEDPAALEELVSRGYMATPVTRIGETWVTGFRRTELERLLEAASE